jgi:hypothetical protein
VTERPTHRQIRRPWLSGRLLDRSGDPISQNVWTDLTVDPDYKTVARSRVGRYHVVTVWRGLDPHVFETRVFTSGPEPFCLRQESYATEVEARAGHARYLSLARMAMFWRTAGGFVVIAAVLVALAAMCSAIAG